jgi:hypothetical protein
MDLAPILIWLKLIHILGALALVLTHGASAAVAFKLRGERDPTRIRALVELSNAYLGAFYMAFTVVLVAGILTGVAAGYWTSGQLWIWVSLIVFFATSAGMYLLAMPHFEAIRHAVGIATYSDIRKGLGPPEPLSDPDLANLLNSSKPLSIAVVGVVGIVLLVYLMVVKPF